MTDDQNDQPNSANPGQPGPDEQPVQPAPPDQVQQGEPQPDPTASAQPDATTPGQPDPAQTQQPAPGYPAGEQVYAAVPPGYEPYGAAVVPVVVGPAPLGKRRSPGLVILLAIATCGVWNYIWSYQVGDELKNYRGKGQGGIIYLVFTFVFPPITMFLLAGEIEEAYNERGLQSPVSTMLGLWFLLPLIGNIIWYLKVQNALNEYWTSLGQTNSPSL